MNDKKKRYYSVSLFIANFLTALYLLSYTGRPISDDEQLYVSATRNISRIGTLSAEQLYGNIRLVGDYHGVEPAYPALASLWLDLFGSMEYGNTQVLYLLPIFFTIISCLMILEISRQMGISIASGITGAMLYGLGTMAWPYTKTFLREPLVGVLLLGSWLAYLAFKKRRGYVRGFWGIVLLVLLNVLVFVKVFYITACFAYLIMFAMDFHDWKQPIRKEIKITFLSALMGIALYIFFTWNVNATNVFYRFSGGLIRDGIYNLRFAPHAYFGEAILGALISPLKGIVFYSPVMILGLLSLLFNWRKKRELFILLVVVLGGLLLFQSLIQDVNWWTPTWGSRFLLPVIPLFVVASLPLIEKMLRIVPVGKFVLGGLFFVSMCIQLPAVLFNSSLFFAETYDYEPSIFSHLLWNFSQSPILLQWRLTKLLGYDLLIWRVFPYQPIWVISFVSVAFVLILISIRLLILGFKPFLVPAGFVIGNTLLSFSLTLVLVFGVLQIGKYDPFYRIQEYKPLCDKLRAKIQLNDLVIVYSYPGELWNYFSNMECGQGIWYSLPYIYYADPDRLEYRLAVDLFTQIKSEDHSRLWFISQYDMEYLSAFEEAEFTLPHYRYLEDGHFDAPVPTYFVVYELK